MRRAAAAVVTERASLTGVLNRPLRLLDQELDTCIFKQTACLEQRL